MKRQVLGSVTLKLGEEELGKFNLTAAEAVGRLTLAGISAPTALFGRLTAKCEKRCEFILKNFGWTCNHTANHVE